MENTMTDEPAWDKLQVGGKGISKINTISRGKFFVTEDIRHRWLDFPRKIFAPFQPIFLRLFLFAEGISSR